MELACSMWVYAYAIITNNDNKNMLDSNLFTTLFFDRKTIKLIIIDDMINPINILLIF